MFFSFNSNTTDDSIESGTVNPSGAHEFIPCILWVSCCSIFVFLCSVHHCLSFVSFGHCIFCPSSMYDFWLPFGIIKPLLYDRLTPWVYVYPLNIQFKDYMSTKIWPVLFQYVSRRGGILSVDTMFCFHNYFYKFYLHRHRFGFFLEILALSVSNQEVQRGLGEMYSIPHYVIKFVSILRQVRGFLRVLRFPPSIKLTATK
jgi:hypothetical protein